jgi:hypothetical protein
MISDILHADLVIADLSFHNPNSFYEIGIRHMSEKPIIHMQLITESPPFDVNMFREIKFSRAKHSDLEKAKAELKLSIEAILAEGYQVTNPVTNARGHLKLEQTATPEMRVLMDEMDRINSRLDTVQLALKSRIPQLNTLAHAGSVFDVQTGRVERFTLPPEAIIANAETGVF